MTVKTCNTCKWYLEILRSVCSEPSVTSIDLITGNKIYSPCYTQREITQLGAWLHGRCGPKGLKWKEKGSHDDA
jgi:hypothetical protein